MRSIIKENKLLWITDLKTFCFDLPKEISQLKREIDFIIKYNEILESENTIKMEII